MTDETETKYLHDRRVDIRLRALMNRMYYQERQKKFEFRDGMVKAVSIFAGSVAFANVTNSLVIQYCAALITASSAASLVFGFGTKARDSARRHTEWALLERDMEAAGERRYTEDQLDQWAARCNEIEAGEPAPHPVMLERCYRKACEALGCTFKPTFPAWRLNIPTLLIP